jgi:hypothetical protein
LPGGIDPGGGTIIGELATSLPLPGGIDDGGGTITGLAKWAPEPGGIDDGGGTITGELAAAYPVLATAPTARMAERKRVLFEIISCRSPLWKSL